MKKKIKTIKWFHWCLIQIRKYLTLQQQQKQLFTAMLIKCIYSPCETSRKAFCCLYLHLSVNQLSIKSH